VQFIWPNTNRQKFTEAQQKIETHKKTSGKASGHWASDWRT